MGIMHQLKESEQNTAVQIQRLVGSVLDLQAKRWGREEQPPIMNDLAQQPLIYNDSPVFYGPDGQILTEEENMFLDTLPNLEFEEYE
jgi:polyadenylate-binding protein-interacting protein 1